MPGKREIIPLSVPYLKGNEEEYVLECLRTNWISSVGRFVTEFEEKFAAYTGVESAAAIVNGTAALHLALLCSGVKQNDLVITQSSTFIAPINAIRYCGADPIFLDIDRDSLSLSPARVQEFIESECDQTKKSLIHKATGRRIAAVLPVHLYGLTADVEAIGKICDKHNLPFIEDAAEAVGCRRDSRHVGCTGQFACFSFNGNKVLTTGGGGMLVSNDKDLLDHARHLSTQAKSHPFLYVHDEVGYNYRMTNVTAAIGLAQLERLDSMIARKQQIHKAYQEAFSDLNDVELILPNCESNYWMALLRIPPDSKDAFAEHMQSEQIQVRPMWSLNHTLPMYQNCIHDDLPESEALNAQGMCIPCWQGMNEEAVDRVISAVTSFRVRK